MPTKSANHWKKTHAFLKLSAKRVIMNLEKSGLGSKGVLVSIFENNFENDKAISSAQIL